MKTAIQALIERAEKAKNLYLSGAVNYDGLIIELNNALKKEQEQIETAFHNGQVEVFNVIKKAFPDHKFTETQKELDLIESGKEPNEDAEDYYQKNYTN